MRGFRYRSEVFPFVAREKKPLVPRVCHSVPPQRNVQVLTDRRNNNRPSDIDRTRPVVFIGDEKRKAKHTSNNKVAKKTNCITERS